MGITSEGSPFAIETRMSLFLRKTLDGNLHDFFRLEGIIDQASAPERFYFYVLQLYLKADIEGLKQHIDGAAEFFASYEAGNRTTEHLIQLSQVRLALRLRTLTPGSHDLEGLTKSADELPLLWKAETYFVVAMAYCQLDDYKKEYHFYQKAAHYFSEGSAKRKSLRARMNALAALTTLNPEKVYINEHVNIAREAKKVRDYISAGNSLMNVSREYERMKAYKVSLKYVNLSLQFLEKESGSLNFYLALAHRAQVYFELGHTPDALADLEQADLSPFPEITQAVQHLKNQYLTKTTVDVLLLDPAWREKVRDSQDLKSEGLSEHEQLLLEFLMIQPRNKQDILVLLYGDKITPEHADNRLKNLLIRIRKKMPHAILFADGLYKYQGHTPTRIKKASSK